MGNVVRGIAPSVLIGTSSNLQVSRDDIKSHSASSDHLDLSILVVL